MSDQTVARRDVLKLLAVTPLVMPDIVKNATVDPRDLRPSPVPLTGSFWEGVLARLVREKGCPLCKENDGPAFAKWPMGSRYYRADKLVTVYCFRCTMFAGPEVDQSRAMRDYIDYFYVPPYDLSGREES